MHQAMHSATLGKMKLFHADTFVYFVTETIRQTKGIDDCGLLLEGYKIIQTESI